MKKESVYEQNLKILEERLIGFGEYCKKQMERSFLSGAFDIEDPLISKPSSILSNAIIQICAQEISFGSKEAKAIRKNLEYFI